MAKTKFYKTEKAARKYCPIGFEVIKTNKGFIHQEVKGAVPPKPAPAPHVVRTVAQQQQPVITDNHKEVTMTEATNYSNIVLRRAFEYLADMNESEFADRDDAHQMLVLKQIGQAMIEVEERLLSSKVESLMAKLLLDGPNSNPRLVAKLARNLAKGLTSQVFSAERSQQDTINELVKAGVAPDVAEARAREPNNYPGAVDDITDSRFRASANLVRQSAEVAYELLNQYFVKAELEYMRSRSMRLGTLPWATFMIDPNVPAVGFHQALDLDEALRWKATQQAQRMEEQREKDQSALRLIAGL